MLPCYTLEVGYTATHPGMAPNKAHPKGGPSQRAGERKSLFIADFPLEMTGGTMNSALRRESQGSLNSSASLDLGFLAFVSSKSEVSGL